MLLGRERFWRGWLRMGSFCCSAEGGMPSVEMLSRLCLLLLLSRLVLLACWFLLPLFLISTLFARGICTRGIEPFQRLVACVVGMDGVREPLTWEPFGPSGIVLPGSAGVASVFLSPGFKASKSPSGPPGVPILLF